MADKKTIVQGTRMSEACGVADTALAPSRHTAAPTSGATCEVVSTSQPADASALPGSGRKSPGVREFWGRFWDPGAGASVFAKIWSESVQVLAQVAGSPTSYQKVWNDKNGNALLTVAIDTVKTVFTFYDSITGDTTRIEPGTTYSGTKGSWLIQNMNARQGVYNRGWTAASGIPAILHRVFADATAADVISQIEDNDGTAQHKTFGDGATENCTSAASGGGLLERTVAATYADGATHALWTSEDLTDTGLMAIETHVIALKSDGTVYGKWILKGTFRRPHLGATAQEGITDTTGSDPANPVFWGADYGLSGNAVVLNVYGELTTTFKAVVRKFKIIPV
jgi:hypothetical protein